MSVDYEPTECDTDPARFPFDHARARERAALSAFPRSDRPRQRLGQYSRAELSRRWRARHQPIKETPCPNVEE